MASSPPSFNPPSPSSSPTLNVSPPKRLASHPKASRHTTLLLAAAPDELAERAPLVSPRFVQNKKRPSDLFCCCAVGTLLLLLNLDGLDGPTGTTSTHLVSPRSRRFRFLPILSPGPAIAPFPRALSLNSQAAAHQLSDTPSTRPKTGSYKYQPTSTTNTEPIGPRPLSTPSSANSHHRQQTPVRSSLPPIQCRATSPMRMPRAEASTFCVGPRKR